MRDHVIIYVNGQRHQIRGDDVFQPLSTWLRESLRLCGTKIVCAEGDCGSCVVLLGKPDGPRLHYQTICSCIQYLFQLDGTHVVTIEGLSDGEKLGPIQTAMVNCHGAQCGFCTPGIVISLCALFDEVANPTPHEIRRGLVGNLCRCTGYEPIFTAAQVVPRDQLRPLRSLYDDTAIAVDLNTHTSNSVLIEHGTRVFCKPTSIAEAVAFKATHARCHIFAGGTDLGVQANKGKLEFEAVLSTRSLGELDQIELAGDHVTVGATVSLARFEQAMQDMLPPYAELLSWFGSPPIKHAGTLGGNIANASSIGDTMPALMVLDATVRLVGTGGTRDVNINAFYTGYRSTVMRPDEILTSVQIPLPQSGELFRVYKVSRRKDLDISTFTAAFFMQLKGQAIQFARIAYGGVAATVLRLPQTEAFLMNRPFVESTFCEAGSIARSEITPMSDVRGAADYRNQLAENILLKFYHDGSTPHGMVRGGDNHRGVA